MQKENRIVLVLGSNQDKENNIKRAADQLRAHFPSIILEKPVLTEPMDCVNPALFLNQVAVATTPFSLEDTNGILKKIECALGRTPLNKMEGNIPIDIDLLIWNDEILKPEDLKRGYIKEALNRLALFSAKR